MLNFHHSFSKYMCLLMSAAGLMLSFGSVAASEDVINIWPPLRRFSHVLLILGDRRGICFTLGGFRLCSDCRIVCFISFDPVHSASVTFKHT